MRRCREGADMVSRGCRVGACGLAAGRRGSGGSECVHAMVQDTLLQLCAALDAGDIAGGSHAQVALKMSDWDEGSGWLTALKRLLKMRASLG